jgi:hypothetical protein
MTTSINVFTPALKAAEADLFKYLNTSCFLVISHDGYWGRGDSVEKAARVCVKEGASRARTATVLLILGDQTPEIDKAGYVVRDAGSHNIKVIERIRLGALIPKVKGKL